MSEPLYDTLKPHVEHIEAGARRGEEKAQAVIRLYHMHMDCPSDPGAPGLCRAAFDEWLAEHEASIAIDRIQEPRA